MYYASTSGPYHEALQEAHRYAAELVRDGSRCEIQVVTRFTVWKSDELPESNSEAAVQNSSEALGQMEQK